MQVSLQLHGAQVQGVQVAGGHSQVHGSQVQGVQTGVQVQGVQLSQQLLQPQLQVSLQLQVQSSVVSPRTANRLESALMKEEEHLPEVRYEWQELHIGNLVDMFSGVGPCLIVCPRRLRVRQKHLHSGKKTAIMCIFA